ncbi:MAG: hypothetical protein CUN56_13515 [Phototrophicales bacterium]|nr:MAG: hypothetical protein CUN56_13515 [Phototrophicales bacterium]RMG76085.1 MAG: LysM peptidoglycan-binding domain-containing protein [Chloroflexota bacterium]
MARLVFIILLFTSGCLMNASRDGTAGITELTCEQVMNNIGIEITCVDAPPNGLILQTRPNVQITVKTYGANPIQVTFDNTVYINAQPDQMMTVTTLDGVSVVAARESVRIVHAGMRVQLELQDGLQSTAPPSNPVAADPATLATLPLDQITMQLPPASQPTLPPMPQATPVILPTMTPAENVFSPAPVATSLQPETTLEASDGCSPRSDWVAIYRVQPGDTLTGISQQYNISLRELVDGNCITDPDRLQLGQEIRVPGETQTSPTLAVGESGAILMAEKDFITQGECTTIQWEVVGARLVYFEGNPVNHVASQQVCPAYTITYTLLVNYNDGTQVGYTVTVTVQ